MSFFFYLCDLLYARDDGFGGGAGDEDINTWCRKESNHNRLAAKV